ncbi:MAG: hypothetical protein COZ34_03280 [Candidatus Pacebacteria bacterium CG_4_10_14_3_um_filter_34_15]|nr:hypothetical protein [Candidatus Pacearchaeota archaeon]NCQ66059.1 hypothetical protein [Candidatus Paceibacterota bacterium]OIO43622.1 MAG: hypothetical protein AUJ41_04600 [Candidatus Pacebacteria bacterium CG1_02_43_31]PIQ81241.1 MAG: hypothetical protein COV78_01375 [Candidatus Pacebacteria bacterium CG11_big_fil_rev_8_21_14_0_20_34_55]PIX81473.1 MAG: hypothetical protein COZ34_03280 [Candidatus Pacebacteria bacterium CG_4_10_14_3_um_filter_34_15]PJC43658.1 MAG: hypothetical protein CO0
MKILKSFLLGVTSFLSFMTVFMITKVSAFNNPVINGDLGGNGAGGVDAATSGATFVSYFVSLWQAFIVIGAVMVLIYFLWGSIEWITAGADTAIVEKARNRITQAMIGLFVLIGSFVIIEFVSHLFFGDEFSILNLEFIAPAPAEEASLEKFDFFAPPVAYAVELNIGDTAAGRNLPGTADYNSADGEAGFGKLLSKVLNIVLVIGALIVFMYLIWGGVEWITAGGDATKTEAARNKITQSMIGLIVLAATVALFIMIQNFLDLEILTFTF